MERVLALSASVGTREWLAAHTALHDALATVSPADAIKAIQTARELGAITFEQSAVLIDGSIDELYWHEALLDRGYHRIDEEREAMATRLNVNYSLPDAEQPFEWRVITKAWERRSNGILAVVLRRVGEHRLANLLVEDPKEYHRIVDETVVGEIAG